MIYYETNRSTMPHYEYISEMIVGVVNEILCVDLPQCAGTNASMPRRDRSTEIVVLLAWISILCLQQRWKELIDNTTVDLD
jgi:hypothetical protein